MQYQVRLGDTAFGLADRFTGDARRWQELRAVDPHRDWRFLRAGEWITLPSSWERASQIGVIADDVSAAEKATSWVTDDDLRTVISMCSDFGIDPSWMIGIFILESGFKPWIVNSIGCTGIMQWCPKYAPVPVATMAKMSTAEQLVYVDQWWRPKVRVRGGPFQSPGEVYCIVIAPAMVSPAMNESTAVYRKGDGNYEPNAWLDRDGDGVIEISDMTAQLRSKMASAAAKPFMVRLAALLGGGSPSSPSSPVASGSSSPSSGAASSGALGSFSDVHATLTHAAIAAAGTAAVGLGAYVLAHYAARAFPRPAFARA